MTTIHHISMCGTMTIRQKLPFKTELCVVKCLAVHYVSSMNGSTCIAMN